MLDNREKLAIQIRQQFDTLYSRFIAMSPRTKAALLASGVIGVALLLIVVIPILGDGRDAEDPGRYSSTTSSIESEQGSGVSMVEGEWQSGWAEVPGPLLSSEWRNDSGLVALMRDYDNDTELRRTEMTFEVNDVIALGDDYEWQIRQIDDMLDRVAEPATSESRGGTTVWSRKLGLPTSVWVTGVLSTA